MKSCPTVSVVIPVLNGVATLASCLEALRSQTYQRIVEILVVDGGSDDGTPDIAAALGAEVLSNPKRIQAAALNIGIREARGEVVVRVDARTIVEPDYVEACVCALSETGAAMVGGAQVPVSTGTAVARGISSAMRSRFGGGTAAFRDAHRSGWVDTVYLGAYWRSQCLAVGGYDETRPTNEDAELALRLSPRGGIWLDARIRSSYMARTTLPALAKQYFEYGRGRGRTVRQYPASVRPRQLAPLLLVVSFLLPLRRFAVVAYGVGTLLSYRTLLETDVSGGAVAVVATPVMHLSWAFGFLRSLAGR